MSLERFRFVPLLSELGWPLFWRSRVAKPVCSYMVRWVLRPFDHPATLGCWFLLDGVQPERKLWSLAQKLVVEHDIEQ